jgi:hypothetical protein
MRNLLVSTHAIFALAACGDEPGSGPPVAEDPDADADGQPLLPLIRLLYPAPTSLS